ncbi:MAG TPA: hypothetical protein VE172_23265 [Stackebrandtia sp.]|jgi:hypothetical protein|uniref:hypothetical protein n=1 Tax=Stackebrandtia sp. TaxID=2023065 RepID=UPI002D3FCC9E|nr:hypothetical protein [Stackebrandtia sp.]HZE41729.1 hypothetical protein [Stackebrandtia sp.]
MTLVVPSREDLRGELTVDEGPAAVAAEHQAGAACMYQVQVALSVDDVSPVTES